MSQTDRVAVDGLELAYELRGSGEPVVLIHWGVSALWAEPLMDEPELADRYRLLSYHRAGFGRSDGVQGAISMADHAAHCAALMRRLGIERAHVVGHSSSAAIALQLALDAPDQVQTLALMEAARPAPETPVQAHFLRDVVRPAVERYRAGDKPAAVDTWFSGVFGPDYRAGLEQGPPGAFQQAVADADAFFGQELPALQQWSCGEDEATRIPHPTLLIQGEYTAPTFPERRDLLLSWLPNAEPEDIPDVNHLLHLQNPKAVAGSLSRFFENHSR